MNDITQFSTAELVAELATRDGVTIGKYPVREGSWVYHLTECGITTPLMGPCKIMVVRE